MAQVLGGDVSKGAKGEFGLATLTICAEEPLFAGLERNQQIWMSHRDAVAVVPPGFAISGTTETCPVAAMADSARGMYGIQFHPEVVHTTHGREMLRNFLFHVCGCTQDWNPKHRIPLIEDQIRACVGNRNVFFFVSGGVDSTVAYTLCLEALGAERVRGVYVDTGLMREGETEFVQGMFESLGHGTVSAEDAQEHFLRPLAEVFDPEQKRHIIGEQFVKVQERIIESRHLLDGHWILGQGTIYPDTIESGGTAKAAVIKTHHNRVAGIQKLIECGRIVEPLTSFYKDEVREIGRELGISAGILDRHPFPGPGLAIRCLCSEEDLPVCRSEEGWEIPIRSVGVQGDSRSYAGVLSLDEAPTCAAQEKATELINRLRSVNRIVAPVDAKRPLAEMRVRRRLLSPERLKLLRRADAIVRELSHASGFDAQVWQFPVVLIPLGSEDAPDSIVLRPIHSVDGMTARSVLIPASLLDRITRELLSTAEICAIFCDLTHKPPATIEWE
jgi:GMP synthase (glutamine-hydrolysing)